VAADGRKTRGGGREVKSCKASAIPELAQASPVVCVQAETSL